MSAAPMSDILTYGLTGLGVMFFLAGTLGLLRFPDTHSRLHALTKADNLGLGLVVLGLLFQADDMFVAGKLLLIWALALLTAGITAQLIAGVAVTDQIGREIDRAGDPKTSADPVE